MIVRRMLRGASLSASSSLPLVSLPLVQSLLTFVTAHKLTSPEPLLTCNSPTTLSVSKFSHSWQSTIHSVACTRQTLTLRRSPPMTCASGMAEFSTDHQAAPAADVKPEDVLRYWFKDADLENSKFPMKFWFYGGEAIDNEIKEKFGECLERAIRGEFDNWKSTPHGRVALVLVLDQFSRNCHRDSHRGYAQDEAALQIALDSIHEGVDQQISNPLERYFLYMPLMHSESLEVHKEAKIVFQKLVEDNKDNPELYDFFQGVVKFLELHVLEVRGFNLETLCKRDQKFTFPDGDSGISISQGHLEKAHHSVLVKFGRYPSRNAVLGRTSTPEEEAYLARGELWPTEE